MYLIINCNTGIAGMGTSKNPVKWGFNDKYIRIAILVLQLYCSSIAISIAISIATVSQKYCTNNVKILLEKENYCNCKQKLSQLKS